MGHHLVAFVNETSARFKEQPYFFNMKENKETCKTIILAFSLLDHSVQETEIEGGPFNMDYDGFIKCNENEIIKYSGSSAFRLARITIESFKRNVCIEESIFKNKALKVKCEEIKNQNNLSFGWHIAQIHKDCLFLYCRVRQTDDVYELWSFDLSKKYIFQRIYLF